VANVELEIQGAIVARLKADPAVTALINGRVYDQPPKDAVFPYVTIGPVDSVDDSADCITGLLVAQQIDCWSRAVGFPEVKRLADAVRASLHDADVSLTVNALVLIRCRQTQTLRDPDGLTSHAVLAIEALIERK
jgi:hypothetical protein